MKRVRNAKAVVGAAEDGVDMAAVAVAAADTVVVAAAEAGADEAAVTAVTAAVMVVAATGSFTRTNNRDQRQRSAA